MLTSGLYGPTNCVIATENKNGLTICEVTLMTFKNKVTRSTNTLGVHCEFEKVQKGVPTEIYGSLFVIE